jgi:hypothetical protein
MFRAAFGFQFKYRRAVSQHGTVVIKTAIIYRKTD